MKHRLPLMLSATALAVAVLGTTPLGHAAGRAISTIPPFAKKAGYATTAGNALHLNGHKASAAGGAGTIPVLDQSGKLPASTGAVGPQGPQGPEGKQGPQGPPGPVDTSKLLGRTVVVTALRSMAAGTRRTDFVGCPTGYEAVGGGGWGGGYDTTDGSVVVVWSAPRVAGGVPPDSPNGGAATGWTTTLFNVSGGSEFGHWTAVCAKVGA